MMLTSWALVCDVYYLPPTRRLPNENAIAFANRVKSLIARKGGLVDLQVRLLFPDGSVVLRLLVIRGPLG